MQRSKYVAFREGSGGRANIYLGITPCVDVQSAVTKPEAHVVDIRLAREEGAVSLLPYWLGASSAW